MLNSIVKWSIAQRWLVVLSAVIITFWIARTITQMPVDVFPSFAPPQVEIQTEAPGLAPEEIESLITLPIESAVNGTPGIDVVRSSSAPGISVVRVVFTWGTNATNARQMVNERLQTVQSRFPEGTEAPQISPPTSPISTIVQYAFTIDSTVQPAADQPKTDMLELRRLIDWQVTNRLLSVQGVSQLLAYGGEARQFQEIGRAHV